MKPYRVTAWALALLLVCCGTVSVLGQAPTDPLAKVKVIADSLLLEANRSLGPRRTVVRRLANRLLTISAVDSVAIVAGPVTGGYWNGGNPFMSVPGTDTVTVCPLVGSVAAWPPIRATIVGDSSTIFVRGGNPLTAMCGPVLGRYGLTAAGDSTTAPRVAWDLVGLTVDGRRLVRPVPRRIP